jgi:2-dehydropantoate 2-reductase
VLIQNGLNIERPFLTAYPTNIVLSGVSMIDSHEASPGHIMHEEADILYLGPFSNPNLPASLQEDKAKEFVAMYSKAGKTQCTYDADVKFSRWRKLVFNACLNPICAITGLDDARIRLADGALDGLVRPAMREIVMTAKALGVQLPEDIMDFMIHLDPMDLYLKPSMQCDIEKGNFLEFENLVGEPLREAEKVGVETPTLRVIYAFCKALQWRTKEVRGKVVVPPKRDIREALD